jgi:hypothetical protein
MKTCGSVLLVNYPYLERPHQPANAQHFCLLVGSKMTQRYGRVLAVIYGTSKLDERRINSSRFVLSLDTARDIQIHKGGMQAPASHFIFDNMAIIQETPDWMDMTFSAQLVQHGQNHQNPKIREVARKTDFALAIARRIAEVAIDKTIETGRFGLVVD